MGHPRITYIVYTANCLFIILSLAFAMGFYTTGLKDSRKFNESRQARVAACQTHLSHPLKTTALPNVEY